MMMDHDYAAYPELTNTQLEELQFSSPHVQITEDFDAKVVKVHDGDTVTLKTDFRDFLFPLRFADVDAPELSAGGEAARDWLKTKVEGEEVRVLIDQNNRVDKWGRLLGRVLYTGMVLGEEEMYLGLAKPYGTMREGEVPSLKQLGVEG